MRSTCSGAKCHDISSSLCEGFVGHQKDERLPPYEYELTSLCNEDVQYILWGKKWVLKYTLCNRFSYIYLHWIGFYYSAINCKLDIHQCNAVNCPRHLLDIQKFNEVNWPGFLLDMHQFNSVNLPKPVLNIQKFNIWDRPRHLLDIQSSTHWIGRDTCLILRSLTQWICPGTCWIFSSLT
jgi:hypothetical protein